MKQLLRGVFAIAVSLSLCVVTVFSSEPTRPITPELPADFRLDGNATILFNENTEKYEVYFRFAENVDVQREGLALWYAENSATFYDVSDCPNINWGDFETDDYVFMYTFYVLENSAVFHIEEIGIGYTNIVGLYVRDDVITSGEIGGTTSGRRGGVGRTGGGERTPPTTTTTQLPVTAPPTTTTTPSPTMTTTPLVTTPTPNATLPMNTIAIPQNTVGQNQILSPGSIEPPQTLPLLGVVSPSDSVTDNSTNSTSTTSEPPPIAPINEVPLNNRTEENPSTGVELPFLAVLASCMVTILAFSVKKIKRR